MTEGTFKRMPEHWGMWCTTFPNALPWHLFSNPTSYRSTAYDYINATPEQGISGCQVSMLFLGFFLSFIQECGMFW